MVCWNFPQNVYRQKINGRNRGPCNGTAAFISRIMMMSFRCKDKGGILWQRAMIYHAGYNLDTLIDCRVVQRSKHLHIRPEWYIDQNVWIILLCDSMCFLDIYTDPKLLLSLYDCKHAHPFYLLPRGGHPPLPLWLSNEPFSAKLDYRTHVRCSTGNPECHWCHSWVVTF